MNKFILLALLVSSPVFSQPTEPSTGIPETPVLTRELEEEDDSFNPRKSHWIWTFGFEGMKYETPYNFQGVQKNFSPGEQELWGGRIGFGGEIYLGAGFVTTTKVEGYYMGTLFSRRLNAGPDDSDSEVSFSKKTGNIYGADVTQSLGYMFDMKTKNPFMDEWSYLTVEPFIEAGIGRANAFNRVNYNYDTGPSGTMEGYKMRVADELTNARVGGGINFTSSSGYFLYLKATVNTYDITKRKTEEFTRQNMTPGTSVPDSPKNVKIDPITVYALGGGYKF